MKNIQPLFIVKALSAVFVGLEETLRSEPGKSVEDFCNGLEIHPNDILYSVGFQALVIFAALVPLKEALSQLQTTKLSQLQSIAITKDKWEKLRIARNSICHGSYEFLDEGKVKFQDLNNNAVVMSPREIIELSNELAEIYWKSLPQSHETL